MSSCNYNNNTVKVKRLPLVDKTNLMHRENSVSITSDYALCRKSTTVPSALFDLKLKWKSKIHLTSCFSNKELGSTSEHMQCQKVTTEQIEIISNDSKFKLIPKVNLRSIADKELASALEHIQSEKVVIGQIEIISNDPKFKLIPKVNLQRYRITNKKLSNTSEHIQSQKVTIEQIISNDPKFKLIPKVHLQRYSIINKELLNTSACIQSRKVTIEQIISNDPKFKLIPKVHLQRYSIINKELLNTSACIQSRKVTIEQIISNDPKFRLISKVHLQCLNIKDRTPNLPSTTSVSCNNALKKNGILESKVSTNSNRKCIGGANHKFVPNGGNGIIKTMKHVVSGSEKVIPGANALKNTNASSDPKFYQKRVVQVNPCKELEEALKLNNKSQEVVIKKVHFTQDLNLTPKFDKVLRKRRTKNYGDFSFKDSLSPAKNLELSYKEHVPVYLCSTVTKQRHEKKDPFEFVSESPSVNLKKKTRKGRSAKEQPSDSDSNCYDESMHEILKRVRRNVKVKTKNKKRVNVKQNNNAKVSTKQVNNKKIQIAPSQNEVQNINFITESNRHKNGLVASNIKIKAGPNNRQKQVAPFNTEVRERNFNTVLNKNTNGSVANSNNKAGPSKDIAHKSTFQKLTQEIQNIRRRISPGFSQNIEVEHTRDDCDNYFGFEEDDEDDITNISRVLPAKPEPNGIRTLNSIKPIAISQRFTSLTSTPLPNTQRRSLKTTETNNQVNAKQINIISNILVSPSRNTKLWKQPDVLKSAKPAVVETATVGASYAASFVENHDGDFLGFDSVTHQTKSTENDCCSFATASNRLANVNTLKRQTSRPWRGDRLNIKRNPHFLTIKDTSLPCYNQDMILKPELLERPKTPIPHEKARSNKVQTTILDFVSSNKINNESTPTKKNHNMSLFDDDDFSPIRNKNSHKDSSPNNYLNDKNNGNLETPKGKRNIFRVCRNRNETSPLRQRNREERFGLENYFGFDSPDDICVSGKENVRTTRNKAKRANNINEEALPMRVPMKQLKKVREEVIEELFDGINLENEIAEEPAVQEIGEDALPNEQSQDEDVPHVGLFEDLAAAVKPPPRIYERKRTKRARAVSVDTDIVEEEKPKRKRKDMLTAAEEKEFNKWAAAFNAMCNEVEKHDLETV